MRANFSDHVEKFVCVMYDYSASIFYLKIIYTGLDNQHFEKKTQGAKKGKKGKKTSITLERKSRI